ncbi:MAG: type II toxin-antitoxin system HicA family toxin [Hyphomicrobium sp.]
MALERRSRAIIAQLQREGWMLVAIEGSHHKFKRQGTAQHIVAPHPKKDLPKPIARKIAKQAGWI